MKLSLPIYALKREARRMSRADGIALAAALDRVAQREGIQRWSLLAAQVGRLTPADKILGNLERGDLLLLGARPGQGKTMLGLSLVARAVETGRRGAFFTLEYTRREVEVMLLSLGLDASRYTGHLSIVTSDDICADRIVGHLGAGPTDVVAVIDYLQVLDQSRCNPPLSEQLETLRRYARDSGAIIGFISQIDRSYDAEAKPLPDFGDVRLPNALDLSVFAKACFLGRGEMRLERRPH